MKPATRVTVAVTVDVFLFFKIVAVNLMQLKLVGHCRPASRQAGSLVCLGKVVKIDCSCACRRKRLESRFRFQQAHGGVVVWSRVTSLS